MKMKEIVIPGEEIPSCRQERGNACFEENGKSYATTISLAGDDRIIPLKGKYVPVRGDYVLGIVKTLLITGYLLDLNSPYLARLSDRDCREEYKEGDVVAVKLFTVNEVNDASADDPQGFSGGELIEIDPVKVPRVIGRNGSMLATIKEYTKTQIFVGKNGRIYVQEGNTKLAVRAILKICNESHVSGLTERINTFLEKESKGVSNDE